MSGSGDRIVGDMCRTSDLTKPLWRLCDSLGPALSPAYSAPSWLAGRVPLKIVFLLVRRVLGLAVLVFRTDLARRMPNY